MSQLSPHFSLKEMTRSDTALRLGINNDPPQKYLDNLILVCDNILEPVRKVWGPVRVNSGYRSLSLNMSVNPMTSTIDKLSKHCTGEAVDFEVEGVSNVDLALWCVANLPVWDKIILEFYTPGQPNSGWVHAQYVIGKQRKESYTAVREGGTTLYKVGILA
jgi:hypothetical protein